MHLLGHFYFEIGCKVIYVYVFVCLLISIVYKMVDNFDQYFDSQVLALKCFMNIYNACIYDSI
jgi:hypothetical protein